MEHPSRSLSIISVRTILEPVIENFLPPLVNSESAPRTRLS